MELFTVQQIIGCGDEAIRAAMRLAPGEAMLLLD